MHIWIDFESSGSTLIFVCSSQFNSSIFQESEFHPEQSSVSHLIFMLYLFKAIMKIIQMILNFMTLIVGCFDKKIVTAQISCQLYR